MVWLEALALFCAVMFHSGYSVAEHPADIGAYMECAATYNADITAY